MREHDKHGDEGEERTEFGAGGSRDSRDRLYTDIESDEAFEEPERDSDYAAVFTEVEEEEEDLPDTFGATASEPQSTLRPPEDSWTAISSLAADRDFIPEDELEDELDEAWEDDAEAGGDGLPLGLIAVGVIALLLLGAGGYGVMQERAAMREEIRQLQASLATAANPAEVAQTRAQYETLAAANRELESQVADLDQQNRNLQAIVGGLETQLQSQQEALAQAKAPRPEPKPAPVAPASASAAATSGSWFVNFGSYSQRATAESWAQRLAPDSGKVVVSPGEKDGRTFYRVRVISLPDKATADATARQLEKDYALSRLWVGSES